MLFKKHYPCLDFLRSLAIILVMALHFNLKFYPLPQDKYLYHFISWGWNGVGLFFALSGFLIGGQIIEGLRAGSFSFKQFYIKRFWRIFPPYYFSLLVVMVFIFTGIGRPIGTTTETIKTLVYHLFYLQNYLHLPKVRLALYWSLAIEEQFYILVPLLLYILWRYCRRYLFFIITGLLLIPIAMRFIVYSPSIDWSLDIRFLFHTRFDSLLFGVVAAYLFITYNDGLRRLSFLTKGIFFLCSLASIGAGLVFGGATNSYFNICWQFTLTAFGSALLTLTIAISSFDSYIHIYPKRFFALVAKLSYTMYLYHILLIYPVGVVIVRIHKILGYKPNNIGFALGFCIYFLVVLSTAAIIYYFIDRPAMNHRRKVLKRMSGKDAGETP